MAYEIVFIMVIRILAPYIYEIAFGFRAQQMEYILKLILWQFDKVFPPFFFFTIKNYTLARDVNRVHQVGAFRKRMSLGKY